MAWIFQTQNGQLAREFFLTDELISIGRSSNNFIRLDETEICSQHAEIFSDRDHLGKNIYFLMDLNSKNGSFVNKNKISCKQLKHKDRIRLGSLAFTFIDDSTYKNKLNNETAST